MSKILKKIAEEFISILHEFLSDTSGCCPACNYKSACGYYVDCSYPTNTHRGYPPVPYECCSLCELNKASACKFYHTTHESPHYVMYCKAHEKRGCIITTARIEAAGLSDDCLELQTFRSFRDNIVTELPNRKEIIEEYYKRIL